MNIFKIQPTKKGLYKLLIMTTFIVIFVNGIIFTFNFRGSSMSPDAIRRPLLPPSYVIGTVWLFLTLCMAYAQWLLIKFNTYKNNLIMIPILFLICIFYPFYTQKFNNESVSLIANLIVISYASFITGILFNNNKFAAILIFLTAIWVGFATFATNI